MKLFPLLFSLAAVVGLSGCATLPPLNFNPPNVGLSAKRLDAELRSTVVTVARPDEKKGELKFSLQYSQTIPDLWKTGVTDALNRFLIFRDDGGKKLNLNIKILQWDTPSFGTSMTTETTARYELVDRNDGTIYYSAEIASKGEVPFNYAFVGMVRALESANRAVQNNISLFLQQLETVDLSKPMFPGRKQ
jgi:hypothetical protein